MDDPKIDDKNIDQEYQVIIWQCPEPTPDPEPAHGSNTERIRLFKDPDQHASNQEPAQHKEQLHTIDKLDPGERCMGFLEHQPMFKHDEQDRQCPHDVKPINPVLIIGMKLKKIPDGTDGGAEEFHQTVLCLQK